MSALPEIGREEFERRLRACSPGLPAGVVGTLHAHYDLLRSWNRTVSLVGPGTAGRVVERHYCESLAALALLEPGWRSAVDVGSGAGFPGFVLAAARPALEVTLVESRRRKAAFLRTVAARTALSCRCLDARVSAALRADLPPEYDLLTLRAVKLPPRALDALAARIRPGGALLWWCGRDEPTWPTGLVPGREVALAGSTWRRVVEGRKPS